MKKYKCVEDTFWGGLDDFMFGDNKKLKRLLKHPVPGGVIWVHGPTCAGKSFLAQCIEYERLSSGKTCVRVSAGEFIVDIVESITKYGSPEHYYQQFYNAEMIIIDELEDFMHRETTQLELAYLISCCMKHSTVVLLSLWPPEMKPLLCKEIKGMRPGPYFKIFRLEPLNTCSKRKYVKRVLRRAHACLRKEDIDYICENTENMGSLVGILNAVLAVPLSKSGYRKIPDLYRMKK